MPARWSRSCHGPVAPPQETLVKALNKLTVNSVRRRIGLSHGLPGSEVNDGSGDGDTSIKASDASLGGSRLTLGWDTTELWRQVWEARGTPHLVTYKPLDEFQSDFKLHSSIPEGEHTVCAATCTSLEVTVDSARYSSHNVHKANGMLYITPFRRDPAMGDADESLGTKPFRVGTRQTRTWSGLTGGWYYLQHTKANSKAFLGYETIEGSLTARIKV